MTKRKSNSSRVRALARVSGVRSLLGKLSVLTALVGLLISCDPHDSAEGLIERGQYQQALHILNDTTGPEENLLRGWAFVGMLDFSSALVEFELGSRSLDDESKSVFHRRVIDCYVGELVGILRTGDPDRAIDVLGVMEAAAQTARKLETLPYLNETLHRSLEAAVEDGDNRLARRVNTARIAGRDRFAAKATIQDIATISTLLERMRATRIPLPRTDDLRTLARLARSNGLSEFPMTDGWGNPLRIQVAPDGYTVCSGGKLNVECISYEPEGDVPDIGSPIILSDGRFVQWPDRLGNPPNLRSE